MHVQRSRRGKRRRKTLLAMCTIQCTFHAGHFTDQLSFDICHCTMHAAQHLSITALHVSSHVFSVSHMKLTAFSHSHRCVPQNHKVPHDR